MTDGASRFKGRFLLEKDGESWLGGQRIDLLEAIGVHGSISQAARVVGVSYRGAWDTVDAMNNQSDLPLVERVAGGKHGGGTRLTEHGRRVIRLFRAMEAGYQRALGAVAGDSEDFDEFHRLLRRFSLTTSARNQFAGRIARLHAGPVHVDVRVRIDADTELAAVVTRTSMDSMRLAEGMDVYALFKAGAVVLGIDPVAPISFENRLCGTVGELQHGVVYSEVSVRLANEKTITAAVNTTVATRMGLQADMPVCAMFNAASVILALV